MTHPLVEALEEKFQAVRDLKAPLNTRMRMVAEVVRVKSPDFGVQVDRFVQRLERAGAGDAAPAVGDVMPDFMLPDEQGRLVQLSKLLEAGPVAIAFHRGHWCPYCRLNAVGLAEVENILKPVQIVTISPERQMFTKALKAESGATFPFLSDLGGSYAMSINLAIWVDAEMASLIQGAGWDLPTYHGDSNWILPVPSVFIVDTDGRVAARHVDPNYRQRMELDALVVAAGTVKPALLHPNPPPATG